MIVWRLRRLSRLLSGPAEGADVRLLYTPGDQWRDEQWAVDARWSADWVALTTEARTPGEAIRLAHVWRRRTAAADAQG